MCRKCHLATYNLYGLGSHKMHFGCLCAGNVFDIPNFLCTGNVPEMLTVSYIFIYATYSSYRKCI